MTFNSGNWKFQSLRIALLDDLKKFIPEGWYDNWRKKGDEFQLDLLLGLYILADNHRDPKLSLRQYNAAILLHYLGDYLRMNYFVPKDVNDEQLNAMRIKNWKEFTWSTTQWSLNNYLTHLNPHEKNILQVSKLATDPATETSYEDNDMPNGIMPRTAIGTLAIQVAWKIERNTKKIATAKEVMSELQTLADSNAYTETLRRSDKPNKSIIWITQKCSEKSFSLEACGKALKTWNLSRDKAETKPNS